MNEQILDLQRIYYNLISWDHHKDIDCHINIGINTQYSYGHTIEKNIHVIHNGYLNDFEGYFKTLEEAERFTIEELIEIIAHQKELIIENNEQSLVTNFNDLVNEFKEIRKEFYYGKEG